MKVILLLLATACLSGCVISRPYIKETTTTPDGSIIVREMRLTSFAIWPASQSVDKQRASVGKTWSLGAVGIEQEGGGTNVVEALRAIDSILGKIHP
jgi:hypothetical protein